LPRHHRPIVIEGTLAHVQSHDVGHGQAGTVVPGEAAIFDADIAQKIPISFGVDIAGSMLTGEENRVFVQAIMLCAACRPGEMEAPQGQARQWKHREQVPSHGHLHRAGAETLAPGGFQPDRLIFLAHREAAGYQCLCLGHLGQ
jgi:hypothetical protein